MNAKNHAFDLGPAIKSIRKARGWTQAQLAQLWGVTINFISQVENGRRGVAPRTMEILADTLGIPTSFLYVLADDPTKKPIGALQELILQSLAKDDHVNRLSQLLQAANTEVATAAR